MDKKNKDGRVIIVSGPSGAGKSTVSQKLVEMNPDRYELIKSVTTRKSRADDEYYLFVTEEMFEQMIKEDAFLETNTYQGNKCMYGTPKSSVLQSLKSGKVPILEIDVNGKKQIDTCKDVYGIDPFSIFITVPPHVLCQRLLDRGEAVDDIICRLRASYDEMISGSEYDMFIVNEVLNDTLEVIIRALDGDIQNSGASLQDYTDELKRLLCELDNGRLEEEEFYSGKRRMELKALNLVDAILTPSAMHEFVVTDLLTQFALECLSGKQIWLADSLLTAANHYLSELMEGNESDFLDREELMCSHHSFLAIALAWYKIAESVRDDDKHKYQSKGDEVYKDRIERYFGDKYEYIIKKIGH